VERQDFPGLTPGDRTRRRAEQRARRQRRRLLAVVGLVVLISIGVAVAAIGFKGDPDIAGATTDFTLPAAAGVGTTTVFGSRPNEAPSRAAVTRNVISNAKLPLHGVVIAIDPGHNGGNYRHANEINRLVNAGTLRKACDTTGTETNSGYTEAAYNFDVAVRLRNMLRAQGARVVMTRTTNVGWGPCITERAAIGNRARADAAISIHADGGPASGRGFHVIYPATIAGLTEDIAPASKRLAIDIRDAFLRSTGMPRSTYVGRVGLDERSDLGGLNLSRVPKVLIETGNMRNATDAALFASSAFREREATGMAAGLRTFLGR
jgi:N-acetylmuramoyl-L-alanine amidase